MVIITATLMNIKNKQKTSKILTLHLIFGNVTLAANLPKFQCRFC